MSAPIPSSASLFRSTTRSRFCPAFRAPVSVAGRARITYECVFVNDAARTARRVAAAAVSGASANTRVVLFHANFGQHSAVMRACRTRRDYVVTLDADLQNPPEEIGKLVEKLTRATITWAPSGSSARTCCGGGCCPVHERDPSGSLPYASPTRGA